MIIHQAEIPQKPENASAPTRKSKPLPWIIATCAVIGIIAWAATRQGDNSRDRSTSSADGQPAYQPATPTIHQSPTPAPVTEDAPAPPPAPATPAPDLSTASKRDSFKNSLGMEFVPVPINSGPSAGKKVLFSVWETRRKDYEAYANANSGVDDTWKNATYEGQSVGHEPLHPVVCVSYDDAVAFCKWLTKKEEGNLPARAEYRLPTDEEWSYAVGIGREDGNTPKEKNIKIKMYPWDGGKGSWPPTGKAGNYCGQETKGKFDSMIEGYDDGYATTSPAGSFRGNEHGLYDMGGNAWEWCGDYYYDGSSGPRVLRGGSWRDNDDSDYLLSSYRIYGTPDSRYDYGGFRCVLVVSGP